MTGSRSIRKSPSRQLGFTLMEVMVAIVVLGVGLVTMLAMFSMAVAATASTQEDLIAKQAAAEALESIYTARNSSQLSWDGLQNAANGGIFSDGPQFLLDAGTDGLEGTADDQNADPKCPGPARCLKLPGKDGVLGTSDDVWLPLNNFTRQIQIASVTNPDGSLNTSLRQITVTITYTSPQFRLVQKKYSVGGYISQFR
ncbi:MAG TPA: prepilin-type N-terminal cleavage/methylation domain-containing protein [Terriglobales bacterium]|nr:prepilin-type N-terminal cleavage/methylation domain-containing protein [Terriglobales bacterium]